MKIFKKLIIEKTKLEDEEGNYILYGYTETLRGFCYRRLFRGTKKECIEKKREILTTAI